MKRKRLRYNRRKVFMGLFLFLCLIGITIGYAFVNTTLSINGTAKVKDAKWNIYFTNFQAMNDSVSPVEAPTVTNTSVTFSAKLDEPNTFYGFTIDVKNEGTINADISNISVTPNFSNIAYIDSKIAYTNDIPVAIGDILPAGKTKTIKVIFEYKELSDETLYPTEEQTLNVTVTLDYEQYTGVYVPSWVLPQNRTATTLEVGDEICLNEDLGLEDQCFNFIGYDGNDVKLLAKYNLNVGGSAKVEEDFLQDSDIRGEYDGMTTYGTAAYILPDNTSCDITNIYNDENCTGLPDTTSYSIAYYVNQYKTVLTNAGAVMKTVRLSRISDICNLSIGCSVNDLYGSCPTTGTSAFITRTTFWLENEYTGTSDNQRFYYVKFDGNIYAGIALNDFTMGVRPVVVVEKNDL